MKNQNIVIRPFDRAADTEKLSNIWFAASLKAHPFIGETRLVEQSKLIEEEYLPKAETWVACCNEEPSGFISLLDHTVGGIFIEPDQQGLGIGRRLIVKALDLKGKLLLEVYTANEQAVRFYRSVGFTELSRRDVDDFGFPYPNATLQLIR